MGHAQNIGSHSLGLKNSIRGTEAERIARNWLNQKGCEVLFERKSFGGVEVDILARHPEGHLLVCEVKSIQVWTDISTRVKESQRQRLRGVLVKLSSQAEIWYLFVQIETETVQVCVDL